MALIAETGISKKAKMIDVGGGASTLAEDLLGKGYNDLTVLDIAAHALKESQKRLGDKSKQINWLEADVLKADLPKSSFGLWHDRAVFHFLTNGEDRKTYIETLKQALKPGAFVIIASFSLEGPEKCSGLDVMRYSSESMSRELGSGVTLVKSLQERHQTPFNTTQDFVYCLFKSSL